MEKRTYRFKMITYPSGRVKCYVERPSDAWDRTGATHWVVTGVEVPEDLKSRGLKVEVEYVFKKVGERFQ